LVFDFTGAQFDGTFDFRNAAFSGAGARHPDQTPDSAAGTRRNAHARARPAAPRRRSHPHADMHVLDDRPLDARQRAHTLILRTPFPLPSIPALKKPET
jgi:hypothetical protein